ncbi:MAG: 30S ribosomal protein S6 [Candidatus Hydrogenedens sp.]|nr:30S ribosomal protein S6 [Candidatus Hydrogenedens sp.]
MRTYEALYIIHPESDDNAIQTITTDVEQLITSNGGSIVRSDVWGKRKLAYTIDKQTEGIYVVLRFQANPEFIHRLEQHFKLLETVIRYMVLYLDAKTLKLEEQQQRQYEEDLRQSAARRSHSDDDDDDDEQESGFKRRGQDSPVQEEEEDDDDEDEDEDED